MLNDRDQEMMDQGGLEARFEYEATIETSLGASSLASGRRRLSTAMIIIGLLAIAALSALVAFLRLDTKVSLIVAIGVAVLATWLFQIDPLVRWQLKRYYSSLIGTTVIAEVRPNGITFLQGEMRTELPWTSFTAIKANDEAVVFLKGRAPLAIMPASAFESPTKRDAFVSLVRTRISAPA